MKRLFTMYLLVLTMLFSVTNANADTSTQRDATIEKSLNAAIQAGRKGPATVELLDQATLNLPKGYLFVPSKEAGDLMEATGNSSDPDLYGLILADSESNPYIITVDYHKSGYIKDEEAKSWNAEKMLSSMQEGTNEENETRKAKGFPTLNITGWLEKPNYNAKSHKLIWSLEGKDSDSYQFVNYNTYALGRDGYFEINLMSSYKNIETNKKDAEKILSSVNYNQGKRYEDYIKGTDKLAEYGIAALVTGIVAKKLGLLALAGVFFIKIWKLIVVGVVFLSGSIKRFFKRKKA